MINDPLTNISQYFTKKYPVATEPFDVVGQHVNKLPHNKKVRLLAGASIYFGLMTLCYLMSPSAKS